MVRQSDFLKLYEEGERLVEYLPYLYEEDNIFLLCDGSLGVIWELSFRQAEFEGEQTLEKISSEFETLLKRLPEGLCYQTILLSSPNVETEFKKYLDYTEKEFGYSSIAKRTIEEKIKYYTTNKNSLIEDFSIRKFRLFFTAKIEPEKKTMYHKEYREMKTQLITKVNSIEKLFQDAHIKTKILNGQELTSLLCNIFNPDREIATHYNPNQEIREQILYTQIFFEDSGLVFNKTKAVVLSLKALPLFTYPGMLTLFSGKLPIIDVADKFVLVCNFYIDQQSKEMTAIKTKNTFAFLHRFNLFGGRSIESEVIQRETEKTIEKIYAEGKKIVNAGLHFIIYHPVDNRTIVDEVLNSMHFLGFEGFEETIIGPGMFLRCCPFGFSFSNERFIKRCFKFVSDNLADVLPFYGFFQGTNTPAQLYLDRHGQVVSFDVFDSNSPHAIISGITGAGKSFFVNDLIMQNLRLGSSFFIFDKGGSYQKLCEIVKGQYVEISLDRPTCINIFKTSSLSTEQLAFLVAVVSEMASGGEEREALRREEKSFIQRCIEIMYTKPPKNGKEHTLSDLVEIMRQEKMSFIEGERLAFRLAPFVGNGQYAGFFDGINQLDIGSNFVVFEMGAVGVWKDLQVVLLLTLMYMLTEFVATQREKRKFLLIDEAWSLLNTENTAVFLENAYRTFRKYRCSVIAITQQAEDFIRTFAGKTILANAVNRFFLAQNPEVISRMKETLSIEDTEMDILKTIKTQKGKYSEVYVKLEEKKGVIRLIPSPFEYWLFTTDPKDLQKIKEIQQLYNCDIETAITHIINKEAK
ncbi:MAG: TraC family protein [Candidatus Micrarchaeia archaeon]